MTCRMASDFNYHGPVVVFDLDDTLYAEREYAVSGYRAIARAESLPEGAVSAAADALAEKRNPMDAMAAVVGGTEEDISRWVEIYRNHVPEISLYPDAAALLDTLKRGGVRMALITDGRSFGQRAKVKALGLDAYVADADIHISAESGFEKPSPHAYRQVVRNYPEASEFWYVADNPAKDFIAPTAMGWRTACLLSRGANIFDQPLPTGADIDINSLTDLLTFLSIPDRL